MVYELINKRKIPYNEKVRLLKEYFYKIIRHITLISASTHKQFINDYNSKHIVEYINNNIPIGLLFQFLKSDIIYYLSLCYPSSDRLYIKSEMYLNLDWNIYIFNLLQNLECKSMMLWFFFCIPYYLNKNYLDNIDNYRLIYIKMLDYAMKHWNKSLFFSEQDFTNLNLGTCITYPIVYHNRNNNDILRSYCKLLRVICPFLNYASPFLSLEPNIGNRKIKICFVSDSFHKDTCVLRDRIGVIGKLIKTYSGELDIYIASFNKLKTVKGQIAPLLMYKLKDKYIWLGNNMTEARTELERRQFDILFYPDIGMKLKPYMLTYSRLAPIQISTWGHSETSGINTIDYYISSKYYHISPKSITNLDLDGGKESDFLNNDLLQSKFSEKLILMNSLSTYYISPIALFFQGTIGRFKTRREFNLRNEWNIYGCLQTFYKFNPEFEYVLKKILERDPKAIILISNVVPFTKDHLIRMYKTFGGTNINRVKWFPGLDIRDYLNLISLCDVILDPFPFGGCNTSFEAFDFNIPVVTYPSNILSGRFTAGMYFKMGITDCIVVSPKHYVNLAVEIVNNIRLKNKISRKIEACKGLIFQDVECINEYRDLFVNLVKKHSSLTLS